MSTRRYSLKAVVAMASNRVIGQGGKLPWHLPADLKLFKRLTYGHPILMGRKTFESIGKPLPGRRNIVISRTWNPSDSINAEVIRDPSELMSLGLDGDVFVIGGGEIYAALLPQCDELFVSFIYKEYPGETRFPEFEDAFELAEVVERFEEFELRRYVPRIRS